MWLAVLAACRGADAPVKGDDSAAVESGVATAADSAGGSSADSSQDSGAAAPVGGDPDWGDAIAEGASWPVSRVLELRCAEFATLELETPACAAIWGREAVPAGCEPGTAALLAGASFGSVADALALAAPCDTVWVCPGTWYEAVSVPDDVALVGLGSTDDSILDATGLERSTVSAGRGTRVASLSLTGGGPTPHDSYGGGLRMDGGEVRNVRIYGNRAEWGGGALFWRSSWLWSVSIEDNESENGGGLLPWEGASVCLSDVTVVGNVATNAGGGLYVVDTQVVATDLTVSGNAAPGGGGAFLGGSRLYGSNAVFSGNEATTGDGGGLLLGGYESNRSEVYGVTLSENVAAGDGGGVSCATGLGGLVDGSSVEGNRATRGGGISALEPKFFVTDTSVLGNEAGAGGGMYVGGGATLTNVDFGTTAPFNTVDDLGTVTGESYSNAGLVPYLFCGRKGCG